MKHRRWETSPRFRAVMRDTARSLRARQTRTEALLWNAVRRNQLGEHARRQQAIGPFVVDFLFRASNLIVEIDGSWHIGREKEDRQRQTALESLGFRFLRVTTREVEENLPAVVAAIRAQLRKTS